MQHEWVAITGEPLVIRIGIASGSMFLGNIGGEGHIEYTAIGPSVNLAARLESACEPGGVLISEPSLALLTTPPQGDMRDLDLKGFESGDVRAFQIKLT